MKIIWHSVAPWISTGYGQQTALFTPRIRDLGYDVAISAFCGLEGTIGSWDGMTVYPGDLTKLNKLALRKYVQRHAEGAPLTDVQVITLQDVWTWIDARIGGGVADYRGLRIASWVPIDHDPAPPNVVQALRAFGAQPIAMSRFGEDRLRKAGFDPLYVPHGVDTQVFRPWPDRDEIRASMKIPADRFVVGMVANNQGQDVPRKAFPQVFAAFAMFLEKKPDAFLYLHTDVLGLNQGLNLNAMLDVYGIPEDSVGFVNQDRYWLGEITQQQMGRVYSAMDVLINPSYGEGFGVPIIEAQACGTPVIVTDWTSMPELVGAGWLVDGDPWHETGSGAWWKVPAISDLLEALGQAYEHRGDQDLREKARMFALQYDVETVLEEHWKPTLASLEGPREIAPLNGNRAMRRAKKKQKAAA
jgi:glycosyltransferase involved in cell wall biosynthesis